MRGGGGASFFSFFFFVEKRRPPPPLVALQPPLVALRKCHPILCLNGELATGRPEFCFGFHQKNVLMRLRIPPSVSRAFAGVPQFCLALLFAALSLFNPPPQSGIDWQVLCGPG